MRLPRLPVSRRRVDELAELVCAYNRIASEDLAEYKRRARKAEARVAELEQVIKRHEHRSPACLNNCDHWIVDRELYWVLDGHDHQERGGDFGGLAGLPREEYDRLRQAAGGDDADIRQPRSGRFKRPLDWAARTGGSFKGARRER